MKRKNADIPRVGGVRENKGPSPVSAKLVLEQCNCTALRTAARLVSLYYDRQLAPSGLRVTQFVMLRCLESNAPISVNELAALLDLDRTTTGRNLQPLIKTSLVSVQKSPNDRRSTLIELRPEGLDALNVALPLWSEAQAKFEAMNGADLSAGLRNSLNAIRVD